MKTTRANLRRFIRKVILEGWAEAEDPQIAAAKARRDKNLAGVFGGTSPTAFGVAMKPKPEPESNWKKEFEHYSMLLSGSEEEIVDEILKYGSKEELKKKIYQVYREAKKALGGDDELGDELFMITRTLSGLMHEINHVPAY